ncbi:MAG: hypothetical protein QW139_01925 [Candidatus Micrarchaeaceae archaeon]
MYFNILLVEVGFSAIFYPLAKPSFPLAGLNTLKKAYAEKEHNIATSKKKQNNEILLWPELNQGTKLSQAFVSL